MWWLSYGRRVGLCRSAAWGCDEARQAVALRHSVGMRMGLRKGRGMWPRRGAARGGVEAQHVAASRCGCPPRWGAAWEGAGAHHAAAQRAQHGTAHGRSVGCTGAPRLRNGRSVWLCGGAAWGRAGAQRGTAQGHRAVLVPLSVCLSPLGCATSCWRYDRGEHWARQAQGAGRERRHLGPGFWCCPVPVPPGGGGGGRLTPGYWRHPPMFVRRREGGGGGLLTTGCWSPSCLRGPCRATSPQVVGGSGPGGGGGARSVGRRFPSFWGPCRFMAQGTWGWVPTLAPGGSCYG